MLYKFIFKQDLTNSLNFLLQILTLSYLLGSVERSWHLLYYNQTSYNFTRNTFYFCFTKDSINAINRMKIKGTSRKFGWQRMKIIENG